VSVGSVLARFNPWAITRETPEIAPQNYPRADVASYTATTISAAYAPYDGWAPALQRIPGGTPDPARIGRQPLYQRRPDASNPAPYWTMEDADTRARESITRNTATGWTEYKGIGTETRYAPNPRTIPPAETRRTQLISPNDYSFWRPFDTDTPKISARALSGLHFSMADHRRNYEIYGMQPQRKPGGTTRNTYRLPPSPWDANIVDMPVAAPMPYAVTRVNDVTPSMSRSWRL